MSYTNLYERKLILQYKNKRHIWDLKVKYRITISLPLKYNVTYILHYDVGFCNLKQ
jgi:hypothetical protein